MNDLSATERCVKCGLCLPHCPTFALTANEADSPRGRISLMQMLEQPASDWSPGLFQHLDRCLMCHACEAMCPSQVPFGHLMDSARQRLEAHRQRSWRQRLAFAAGMGLLTSGGGRKLAAAGLYSLQRLRLERVPGLPASLRRWLQLVPRPTPDTPRPATPAIAASRGPVNLFTGCTGDLLDKATRQAVIDLLGRLGYSVTMAARQGCCGALHQHAGQPGKARQLARANGQAFADSPGPILAFASGCCAHLQNYAQLYPETQAFTERVHDVTSFLAAQGPAGLNFRPRPEKVALQMPCTQRNQLGAEPVSELLSWIPQLQVTPINPEGGCCGAAGSYMLTQPQMSDRLREAMVEKIVATGARVLLTTNIGCSLQLGAGLRQKGVEMALMHPVTLLAAQLA